MINMTRVTEHEIVEAIRTSLEGFPAWTDLAIVEDEELASTHERADARIRAKVGGGVVEFLLEVKSGSLQPDALEKFRRRSESLKLPLVLARTWIPANRARTLREQGVNYLDTAGNAFLNLPGLQVFRETNDLPKIDPVRKRPGEIFNASAVRVGLQLLLDPQLVGSNLRAIAALAGVSAPSAKFALDAFKADGYVIEVGKNGRRLVDREGFLRKWAECYNLRYRPKHALGKYVAGPEDLRLDDFEACWGGEPGADRLTNNLQALGKVVYAYSTKVGPLVAKNRLRPDSRGGVELVRACWEKRQEEPQGTAPAFVVFADLLETRDPRCIEVAEQIFDTILKPRLEAGGD